MHRLIICRAIGGLLLMLGAIYAVPVAVAWTSAEDAVPWLVGGLTTLIIGGTLLWLGRRARPENLGLREGLATTCLAWVACSATAAIGPWVAVDGLPYLDAWFEMLSGFTTTGSSIFGGWDDGQGGQGGIAIGDLGHAVLAWRATSQLLGGIGIVVISLALLPVLASGSGYQLYRSEVSGIEADRLAPRVIDTARILVGFYLLLFGGTILALRAVGVEWFPAACHAASAISTGGFSTYDDSVTGLRNQAAEWVLIAAMLAGGVNFALLIRALRGRFGRLWASEELRLFLGIIVVAWIALLLLVGWQQGAYAGRSCDLVRDTLFQTVSTATSTGFATGFDAVPGGWEGWLPSAQLVLLLLMIGGACAGSTTGGLKLVRVIVLVKLLRREIRRHGEPNRLTPVMLDGRPVADGQLLHVAGFVMAFAVSWIAGTLALALCGLPLGSAASGALTCLANNGPGIDAIGVAHNFGPLPVAAKLICMALMLLGRLEFFGVLMVCSRRHWR